MSVAVADVRKDLESIQADVDNKTPLLTAPTPRPISEVEEELALLDEQRDDALNRMWELEADFAPVLYKLWVRERWIDPDSDPLYVVDDIGDIQCVFTHLCDQEDVITMHQLKVEADAIQRREPKFTVLNRSALDSLDRVVKEYWLRFRTVSDLSRRLRDLDYGW